MIRVDAVWRGVEPLDMRAGTDTALARVVQVFGEARAHHAYLFTNRRAAPAPGSIQLGRLRVGWPDRDQRRAAARPDARIALAAFGRAGDDPYALRLLLSPGTLWHHRVHAGR